MILNNHKLGEFIYEIDRKNTKNDLGMDRVRGISNTKQIMKTKADVDESVLHKFYIINPGEFIYNPRTTRMGEKVGLAFNDTNEPLLFSFNNIAFGIKNEAKDKILPEYLYIYYNRPEFDRYAIKNSWGSATEIFSFDEMCDIDIEIPDIEIQKKYVAIYKSMLENQKCYERGLEDLKLTCDAYFDIMKKNSKMIEIGKVIEKTDIRNKNSENYKFKGLSMENYFIDSIANEVGIDFSKYKVVQPDEFACVLMKVGRDCRLTVAQNTSKENYIISPAYYTFKLKGINPRFFMSYISRSEFERRAWFSCDTSLRGSLPWEEFCELKIPDVEIKEQKIVADLYDAYIIRNEINEKLKEQIKNICPILIKGSLEEAKSN